MFDVVRILIELF